MDSKAVQYILNINFATVIRSPREGLEVPVPHKASNPEDGRSDWSLGRPRMTEWKKVEPIYRDWARYNDDLVVRGAKLTDLLWLHTYESDLARMNEGKRGAPYRYTPGVFLFADALMSAYGVQTRAMEGILANIMGLFGLEAPDHSTIWLRVLEIRRDLDGPELSAVCAADSSGLSVGVRGEWIRDKWGHPARGYVKVHLLADVETHMVAGYLITDDHAADVNHLLPLVDDALSRGCALDYVVADSAYDAAYNWDGMMERGIGYTAMLRKKGIEKTKLTPQGRARFEYGRMGEEAWKASRRYGLRSHVEGTFSDFKRMFGPFVRARKYDNMVKEVERKLALFNMLKRCTN